MSNKYEITDEETNERYGTRTFLGLDAAVENSDTPVAISVRWSAHVPEEIRRKLTYRFVDKTENGTGPRGIPVLIAEGEGLRYISNPSGPKTEVYHGLLTVENDKKKTVNVYSMNNYCLYPDFSYNKRRKVEQNETAQAEQSYREKNENLIAAFGSLKGTRMVNARQRNALVSQRKVEDDVARAIEESVPLSSINVISEENSGIDGLPPHHLDAKRPQDAYLFADLLTEAEMDSLVTAAQTFVDSNYKQIEEWRANKTYPNFILKNLEYLPSAGEDRRRRSAMLTYYRFLYIIWNMKAPDWRGRNPLPADIPDRLKKKLLAEFTKSSPGHNKVYVPKDLKDKTLLHLCVMALILSDFSLNMSELEEEIGRKLRVYFEQLGCKVMAAKNKGGDGTAQLAVLKTPLTFPKPRAPKRKAP